MLYAIQIHGKYREEPEWAERAATEFAQAIGKVENRRRLSRHLGSESKGYWFESSRGSKIAGQGAFWSPFLYL
jgi:hypothetical protein